MLLFCRQSGSVEPDINLDQSLDAVNGVAHFSESAQICAPLRIRRLKTPSMRFLPIVVPFSRYCTQKRRLHVAGATVPRTTRASHCVRRRACFLGDRPHCVGEPHAGDRGHLHASDKATLAESLAIVHRTAAEILNAIQPTETAERAAA